LLAYHSEPRPLRTGGAGNAASDKSYVLFGGKQFTGTKGTGVRWVYRVCTMSGREQMMGMNHFDLQEAAR